MTPRGATPDYQDVQQAIQQAQARGGSRVHVRILGRSVEGREIPCIVCTDPAVADEDKQRVFVVAGQHGAEESGRAIALALLDFLLSDDHDAREILRRQVIAIAPCANPDGAQRDTMRSATGANIPHSYRIDGPSTTPEGWCLERFGLAFAPEVFVDLHGQAGGAMKDWTWLSPAWDFSSDRHFLGIIALEMTRAAEQAGYPQIETRPAGTINQEETWSHNMLGAKLAAEVKSLSLGIETIEQHYRLEQWSASGMARLRRLLRFGQEDGFGLGMPGYPGMLISGTRTCGLLAHGATAASQRANRIEVTNFVRRNLSYISRGEDGLERCATMFVSSDTCEGLNPERFSLLVRIRKPCQLQAVEWKGEALPPGPSHGYQNWDDANSLFVKANILEPFGGPERFLTVRYGSPLFAD